jgi:hypothetical protein
MANIIRNWLYIKGPTPLVDEFITSGIEACNPVPPEVTGDTRPWCSENWGSEWIRFGDYDTPYTIDEVGGIKTAHYSFDSKVDPPIRLFDAVVVKYHKAGLRFFFHWYDDDDYAEFKYLDLSEADKLKWSRMSEDVVITRFGVCYTETMPCGHTVVSVSEPPMVKTLPQVNTDGYGARYTNGPITYVFSKRPDLDGEDEVLTCEGVLSYVPVPHTPDAAPTAADDSTHNTVGQDRTSGDERPNAFPAICPREDEAETADDDGDDFFAALSRAEEGGAFRKTGVPCANPPRKIR